MATARFAGKVALITGASGTIGAGIATQFLEEGAKVIAPARSQSGVDSIKKHVAPSGIDLLNVVESDISKEDDILKLVNRIREDYGRLDHIVTVCGGWWQKGVSRSHTLRQRVEEGIVFAYSRDLSMFKQRGFSFRCCTRKWCKICRRFVGAVCRRDVRADWELCYTTLSCIQVLHTSPS
jgi:NAD(P)-dependent dehydrogenase (short-subunit alcohol dehydrogenase family)